MHDSSSPSSPVKCRLPAVSTIYSSENFMVTLASESLNSGNYFGTSDTVERAFDDDNVNIVEDEDANCVIGMEFKPGYVGMLT